MRSIIGISLMVAGLLAGLYVGLWWAFIGGIVEIVSSVMADYLDGGRLAWGILRFACASVLGVAAGLGLFLPGLAIWNKS